MRLTQTGISRLGIAIIILGILMISIVLVAIIVLPSGGGDELVNSTTTDSRDAPVVISTNVSPTGEGTDGDSSTTPIAGTRADRDRLVQLSKSFAERFGSFSSESAFKNVTNLHAVMTASMRAWADQYVADAIAAQGGEDTYYGVTTNAVAVSIDDYDVDAGTALVTVATQRQEEVGQAGSPVFTQQTLVLAFVSEEGNWLVDAAGWQ